MKEFIAQYNDNLNKIKKNQERIEVAINEIKHMQGYINAAAIYNQITVCLQQIYDRLLTLENAVTFSNLDQLHPSVVDSSHLLEELKNIEGEIDLQIPYKPTIDNIHVLIKSITVKAYSTNESLNFILEIPLVTNKPYSLLHLYGIPNENNTLLIPKSPYLILGSNEFAYPREQCIHVTDSEVICRHVEWQALKKSEDCIAQLIQHEKPHNCSYAKASFENNIIQQVKENSWIVVLKREEVIKSTCGNDVIYQRSRGVSLITVNNKCRVKIAERTLTTHRRFLNVQESIPLPKTYSIPSNFTISVKLEDVPLDNLEDILQKAKELEEPVYMPPVSSRPSWSSISLYIIIISISAVLVIRWYLTYRKKTSAAAAAAAAAPADVQQIQQQHSSARFSLKGGGVTLA
ncbi:uncharacterized protein [Epargyreus clarus]|uniref:uncharacterized protein n=1 Tax=Epargyreus clarus TaxID=520877 RepID=UPI003C2EB824